MLRVKKLNRLARLPVKQHQSAGYDLYSCQDTLVPAGKRCIIGTGIALEFPENYVGRICDRSGMAAKKGLHVLAGVIDSDFRGEVGVVILNTSEEDVFIKGPARIAQLLLYEVANFPVVEVEELSDTLRGRSGFGSTGAK